MVFGLSLSTYTIIHVIISLIAIAEPASLRFSAC
jgi:hypothetical protein